MLDPKEEQKYNRLRKLAQGLHIPICEAFLTLEVFGKDGKLLQRHHQRSHSWTRNIYNIIFVGTVAKLPTDDTFGAGLLSLKDTGGDVRYSATRPIHYEDNALDSAACAQGIIAPAANDDYSILVGSGISAESFDDYALETKIVEGSGAGQLNHVQSEGHSISYAALTLKDELVRYLNNNSGGNVDVNEVALAVSIAVYNTDYNVVISRDHLASTVTVPDTGQLKVTYTVQLTYPS